MTDHPRAIAFLRETYRHRVDRGEDEWARGKQATSEAEGYDTEHVAGRSAPGDS